MPYAINILFDPDSEREIDAIWKEFYNTDIASYLHQSDARPHIKLSVYENIDIAESKKRLESLSLKTNDFPVVLKFIGIFANPKPTVFLGAAVSKSLTDIQCQVVSELNDIASPVSEHFQPGQWVPHCLLAVEMDPQNLSKAIDIGSNLSLPIIVRGTGIGAVAFRPVNYLYKLPLLKN